MATVADLIVVSNRGPLSFQLGDEGRAQLAGSGGGLATTLQPLVAGRDATWIASSMSEADHLAASDGLMNVDGMTVVTVRLDADTYRMAYDVVSNATLWYCHHHLFDLPRRPRFDVHFVDAWDAYVSMNESFADEIARLASQGATVLVQDYHFALLGKLLEASRPDLRTVHFTHTPFGDPSALRVLPANCASELLEGMAGFGACGFHAPRWKAAFDACYHEDDLTALAGSGVAPYSFVAPLGPDPVALENEAAESTGIDPALERVVGERMLILRVDRIELSKNIIRGLFAFEELLDEKPEWRDRVVMVALAYPSRESLADYLAYRSEVEHTVERINDRFGTDSWTPIVFNVADDRSRSVAAYMEYDVLLVNPVRDGLNLVAKEGPFLNRNDGSLVLSREAGAFDELKSGAFGINPFDVTETAAALHGALGLDRDERAERARTLKKLVVARTASDWMEDQLRIAGSLER